MKRNSIITITPVTNIKNNMVVDSAKIEQRAYDSDMDVFVFHNVVQNKTRKANLMNVSLYDDVIVEGDKQYKILHMLTKAVKSSTVCNF